MDSYHVDWVGAISAGAVAAAVFFLIWHNDAVGAGGSLQGVLMPLLYQEAQSGGFGAPRLHVYRPTRG